MRFEETKKEKDEKLIYRFLAVCMQQKQVRLQAHALSGPLGGGTLNSEAWHVGGTFERTHCAQ